MGTGLFLDPSKTSPPFKTALRQRGLSHLHDESKGAISAGVPACVYHQSAL
jgi:hypothetical protein